MRTVSNCRNRIACELLELFGLEFFDLGILWLRLFEVECLLRDCFSFLLALQSMWGCETVYTHLRKINSISSIRFFCHFVLLVNFNLIVVLFELNESAICLFWPYVYEEFSSGCSTCLRLFTSFYNFVYLLSPSLLVNCLKYLLVEYCFMDFVIKHK